MQDRVVRMVAKVPSESLKIRRKDRKALKERALPFRLSFEADVQRNESGGEQSLSEWDNIKIKGCIPVPPDECPQVWQEAQESPVGKVQERSQKVKREGPSRCFCYAEFPDANNISTNDGPLGCGEWRLPLSEKTFKQEM